MPAQGFADLGMLAHEECDACRDTIRATSSNRVDAVYLCRSHYNELVAKARARTEGPVDAVSTAPAIETSGELETAAAAKRAHALR